VVVFSFANLSFSSEVIATPTDCHFPFSLPTKDTLPAPLHDCLFGRCLFQSPSSSPDPEFRATLKAGGSQFPSSEPPHYLSFGFGRFWSIKVTLPLFPEYVHRFDPLIEQIYFRPPVPSTAGLPSPVVPLLENRLVAPGPFPKWCEALFGLHPAWNPPVLFLSLELRL